MANRLWFCGDMCMKSKTHRDLPLPTPAELRSMTLNSLRRRGRRFGLLWCVAILLLPLVGPDPALASGAQGAELHKWRAARRASMRQAASTAKSDSAATLFGLLVIPVDFADSRLPAGWDPHQELAPRLLPLHGETLVSYYRVASRQQLDLRILLTPLVKLPGERLDYSDVGRLNFHRTRRLATAAITAARDMGVSFRQLDMEGPDRRPGSPDDDGEVDGVFILHAATGEENDPENGLIQALQYFIDPAVADRGVVARNYAVASMQSGLGIWAHEVGHLFGLEDRYDPGLPSVSDAIALGGLGQFSLMAAGAWGRGDGSGAALLDAYSAAQLGWLNLVDYRGQAGPDTLHHSLHSGIAWRVWTQGRPLHEYFILESRGGGQEHPFDAVIPTGQLLIYHVDEQLAEGEASSASFPERHIRVALVEADADDQLRQGYDLGHAADLFPGPLGVTDWTAGTVPSSWGYNGPTEISLTDITSLEQAVVMQFADAASFGFQVDLTATESSATTLQVMAQETGVPASELTVRLSIASSPAWGVFAGGTTSVDLPMQLDDAQTWSASVEWLPDTITEPVAETLFHLQFFQGGEDVLWQERSVIWQQQVDPLDFDSHWPHDWTVTYPGGRTHTTWHRWQGSPNVTADDSPVLVCTGEIYTSPTDWPDARYGNLADAVLTSGSLSPQTVAVRIVHALAAEISRPGAAWDAALVELELPDGSWQPIQPLQGYNGVVIAKSRNPLHGRPAFTGVDSLTAAGPYAWRMDIVPLPSLTEPARLRLRLASDERITARGWVIARLQSLDEVPTAAFPVAVLPAAGTEQPVLAWDWPWETASQFAVETSIDQGVSWQTIWEGLPMAGTGEYPWAVNAAEFAGGLAASPQARNLVRVIAQVPLGKIASHPVVLYRDGGATPLLGLGLPYPNPAPSSVRFMLQLAPGQTAELSLYDIRGRLVRDWNLVGGQQLLEWDGMDGEGRRAAAGTYLLQLRAGDQRVQRKVVLLP
jgi:M6 family metalloprotease-like protein